MRTRRSTMDDDDHLIILLARSLRDKRIMDLVPKLCILIPCIWACFSLRNAYAFETGRQGKENFHRQTTHIALFPYHHTHTDSSILPLLTGNSIDLRSLIKNILAAGVFASTSNLFVPVPAVAANESSYVAQSPE
jgi:hypothetical protein